MSLLPECWLRVPWERHSRPVTIRAPKDRPGIRRVVVLVLQNKAIAGI